jgi:hypothetical protein
MTSEVTKLLPRPRVQARGNHNARPVRADRRSDRGAVLLGLDMERWWMASWLMRLVSSPGKSSRRRQAICCGLRALAHRRSCRGPCGRPFHGTTGSTTAAPLGALIMPASRTSIASLRGVDRWLGPAGRIGRRATGWWRLDSPGRRCAWPHCAATTREIVEAARPSPLEPRPAPHNPRPAEARSPHAPRTRDTARNGLR